MDGEALEALRYFSDATHPQSFVTLAGRGPVLVSAPHAVLQTRSGRLKAAERYTGMLCLMLNRRHDVPGIYKARHLMDDANHDPSSPYRNEVCRLIRERGISCVLDLHQLRPDRSMALCIGTGRGRHVLAFEGAPDVVRSAFMRPGTFARHAGRSLFGGGGAYRFRHGGPNGGDGNAAGDQQRAFNGGQSRRALRRCAGSPGRGRGRAARDAMRLPEITKEENRLCCMG